MTSAYPAGTIERWAHDYLVTTDLAGKRAPPPPPRAWAARPEPLRVARPGRPPELRVVAHAPRKSPGRVALAAQEKRAALVHTFLHHEFQAAELMCWAILAFAGAPEPFRAGLLGVARDEIRHLGLYEAHLATLGARFGGFPVRDWFWERVPLSASPAQFVATLGIGLEGANLDHTARFAERFEAAGDPEGAALQALIGEEEVSHVRFALRWFERFTGELTFASWAQHLPPPLSPLLMRGQPLNREARLAAGFSEAFVDELTRWQA